MHEKELKETLLERGEYRQEGLQWHCAKNYYVLVERTWLSVFFILLLSILFVLGFNIYSLLPLKTTKSFLHYTDALGSETVRAVRLYDIYKKNNDLQTVVDKYLISMYIKALEEGKSWQGERDGFVKANSSYLLYEKLMGMKGGAPSGGARTMEIGDIRILGGVKGGGKVAMVKMFDKGGKASGKTIKLAFRTTDVLLVHKNIAPLELVVSGYEEIF